MKNRFILILALGLMFNSMAMAQDVISDHEQFCKELIELKKNQSGLRGMAFKVLWQKIFPGSSFRLQREEKEFELSERSSGRKIVLSLGLEGGANINLEEWDRVNRLLKKEQKKIISILRSKSISQCLRKMERKNFSLEYIQQLVERKNLLDEEKKHSEWAQMERIFSKIPRKDVYDWEYESSFHVTDLMDYLLDPEVSDIMMVVHASSDGSMMDAYNNILPLKTFLDLNRSVNSLSVYSCYPQKVLEKYKLKDAGPVIFWAMPKDPSGREQNIMTGFPSFFKKVVRQLPAIQTPFIPQDRCEMEILGRSTGELAVLLGDDTLVGYVMQDEVKTYPAPCSAFKNKSISVRSLNPAVKDVEVLGNWFMRMGDMRWEHARNFYDEEGMFESALWRQVK